MLSPRERITKARIQLTRRYPFFGYLSLYLTPKETTEIETMGVDIDGNLYYNPEFVKKLNDNELLGTICHEILHVVFQHPIRGAKRHREIYNISADAVVNSNLIKQNLVLPKGAIVPDYYTDKINLVFITDKGTITITIDKPAEKTADEIYDIVMANLEKKGVSNKSGVKGKGSFDKHIYSDKKGKSKNKSKSTTEKAKEWAKRFQEALEYARQRGNVPAGFERLFDKIHGNYLNWRQLLYKYITRTIPIDFTYARPSKKSYALKTYFPNIVRESLNVVVAVDTSGSISDKEISDALSEVIGIVNSFRGIQMTIIYADAKVKKVVTFRHPTLEDILKEKPVGGGGTDHRPVFDYIEKHLKNTQLVIAFTDMWTIFPQRCSIPTLWINFDKTNKNKPPFGIVINYDRNC